METWLAVVLALTVPLGWGVLSAWAFDRVRAHLARSGGQERDLE